MSCIIYFNGFEGKNSNKFNELINFYKNDDIKLIQFDQSFNCHNDTQKMEKILLDNGGPQNIKIIASSLGSIPAIYLSFKFNISCVLINPSFYPKETLSDKLSKLQLSELESFKLGISIMMDQKDKKDIYKTLSLYIANDDERILPQNRIRFSQYFEKYILYTNISPNGGHTYTIFESKLKSIHNSLYKNEIDKEDFFQTL